MKRNKDTRTIKVTMDASTWRWLRALARAHEKSDLPLAPATPAGLLAQAAFCFADAAGRRPGSWEADVGRSMLISSGFQEDLRAVEYHLCKMADDLEHEAWRKKQAEARPGQPGDPSK